MRSGVYMIKRDFVFNIKIGAALFASSVIAVSLDAFGFIHDDIFVQIVLWVLDIHAIPRCCAIYFYKNGSPRNARNAKKH